MMHRGVFCDTSFFIRLLDKNTPLHENAKGYFRYFTGKEFELMISTIVIAEYCVGGTIHELPLKNLRIVPYNLNHAQRTSELARVLFQAKKSGSLNVQNRTIIPNDTKLFAQADCEKNVEFYLSADTESKKIFNRLQENSIIKCQFLDINTPHHSTFGLLNI